MIVAYFKLKDYFNSVKPTVIKSKLSKAGFKTSKTYIIASLKFRLSKPSHRIEATLNLFE